MKSLVHLEIFPVRRIYKIQADFQMHTACREYGVCTLLSSQPNSNKALKPCAYCLWILSVQDELEFERRGDNNWNCVWYWQVLPSHRVTVHM